MGTWATPHTIKKAQRLEALMKVELSRARAEQDLYNILGDGRLYDSFNEYGPEDDVRFLIAHRLSEILDLPADMIAPSWDDAARTLCRAIITPHI